MGQRVKGVSRQEMERRWALMRAILDKRGIDVALAVGQDALLSGHVRWLTDTPVMYRKVVLFFRDGPMTLVDHGATGAVRTLDGDDANYPGVGEIVSVAEFPSVSYCQDLEVREIVRILDARGVRRVGLINAGAMPHAIIAGLQQGLGNVEFHDISNAVDEVKAVKSAEEQALLRETAKMQDGCFARALLELRPGVRDHELAAAIQQEGRHRGGETGIVFVGSAPLGTPAFFQMDYLQGRQLSAGDHASILIENPGPGGYFTELSRVAVLGAAPAELTDAFEIVREIQQNTLSLCKPGALFADIYAAHNSYLESLGQPAERRLYGHGQGHDMVERPLIWDDEGLAVEEGMCLTVHPGYATQRLWVTVTDNYLIGPDGPGKCLHDTEQRIFEVECR